MNHVETLCYTQEKVTNPLVLEEFSAELTAFFVVPRHAPIVIGDKQLSQLNYLTLVRSNYWSQKKGCVTCRFLLYLPIRSGQLCNQH